MNRPDDFQELAHYYDQLMDHVDYDRWLFIAGAVAGLLPKDFTHLDLACGTGVLTKRLRQLRWRTFGADLSPAMIRAGRRRRAFPAAVANLTALPFCNSADYVTCLFDSLNFLLTPNDLEQAFRQIHGALRPGGLVYCDVITERMVLDHFHGQRWEEESGRLTTAWASHYDASTGIAETEIRVNRSTQSIIRERIYPFAEVEDALRGAGLALLGVFDAETWRKVGRKTLRIDVIAGKEPLSDCGPRVKKLAASVSRWLSA